ncbi:MAG: Na-translocating system protein MpsC family protein [Solirubrobacteraceae bacterium]
MSNETDPERAPAGSIYLAISNAVVGVLREYTGRGPTKARTTIRDNVVLVMLEQTLTKGEQVLVDKRRGDRVLALRREYQEAMREATSARVAELTGRTVIAMMSANHLNPDLGAEIDVLDGSPNPQATALETPET